MKAVDALFVVALTAVVLHVLYDPYRVWTSKNGSFVKWVRENRDYKSSPSDLRAMYELNTRPISLEDAPFFFDKYVASLKA